MATLNLPHGSAAAAIELRQVSKTYGKSALPALQDVSLTIRCGEFFSLLGPSGSGKSSLLRIIGGFEANTSGQVLIDGQDAGGLPPFRRSTNMIFQHLALFPHMTVFENIAFGLRRKKINEADIKSRVEAALAMVQLPEFAMRMTDQLSGGQKQRIAIARALINEPSVLLLDEPLAALDLQLRIQMHAELRRLHKTSGRTFIYVTHDQSEAMSMSDRIGVMRAGRIEQVGSPEDIYNRPANRFVAAFVGHTNLLDGHVTRIGDDGMAEVDCRGVLLHATRSPGMTAGQPCTVTLRYERINVTAPGEGRSGGLEAKITGRTYLGQSVRFEMLLDQGLSITADVDERAAAARLSPGDSAALSFDPGAAVALVNQS
jgi:spermidine/putrescine transport system ATP-binding protein